MGGHTALWAWVSSARSLMARLDRLRKVELICETASEWRREARLRLPRRGARLEPDQDRSRERSRPAAAGAAGRLAAEAGPGPHAPLPGPARRRGDRRGA